MCREFFLYFSMKAHGLAHMSEEGLARVYFLDNGQGLFYV